jgi:hypothetical protein
MKNTTSFFIPKLFVLILFLSVSIAYSQNKKAKSKTIFGQTINSKNVNPNNGYTRCVTTEYEKFLQEKNPKRMTDAQFEAWLTPLVKQYKTMRTSSESGGIITIPVVVHVIHSGQTIGIAPNISDAQVQSQITVMNEDYRKMAGTPGDNANPVGVDTKIQFALAQQDPNGNPTDGIDRVSFCQDSWTDTDVDLTVKPATIWNPALYLNMWSVQFTDITLLGYAQFPDASGLLGLNASGGSADTDGVVSNYSTFGSSDYGTFLLDAPYDKGRTMTHEVGHWLGLRHIWGDAPCGDDFCADTPVHHDNNFGCPSVVNCDANGNEMVENYMDYTDDLCMNVYTQNQKDRIVTIMNNAARRSTLKASAKNSPIALFANDAEVKVEANCSAVICGAGATQKITIYNRGTSTLTSASLNYNVNGINNTSYNWSGSLTTHKSATFDMPVSSAISGTINVSVVMANSVTDQRATNNSASGNFILPVAPTNYTFTNYVFRLQRDLYGSETTWSLKNSSGVAVYNGGPYTDTSGTSLPALLTIPWTLASNQCYTFTINDSFGDGICCVDGNGFYDIKSTDGATTIKAGATFVSSEIALFTTNTLGNKEFESSNEIYLYPNPTKTTLNIKIPSEFGLPNSYTIYNYLGQSISKKQISKESDLSVNTSALSNGSYFITITKGNEKKTLQFIKE